MAKKISQFKLPDPHDTAPHPRLLLDGYGIHAGQCFRALFPDGWHDITLGGLERNRPGLLVHLYPWLFGCLSGWTVCGGIKLERRLCL